MLVSNLGGDCRTAQDGETGVALVREFQPDVVLLDIGLPGIDGYETCRRLRAAVGWEVTIVAMTGWGQDRDKAAATAAGFDRHLTKPVDPDTLREVLARAPPVERDGPGATAH
jgi:DNA-binding response OmpR family regulator